MVPSPALQAASEALLQLQSKKGTQSPHTALTKKQFADELAKNMTQRTSSGQLLTGLSSGIRPLVYIPMAAEFSAQHGATSTTPRRNKKTKNTSSENRATAPYSKK